MTEPAANLFLDALRGIPGAGAAYVANWVTGGKNDRDGTLKVAGPSEVVKKSQEAAAAVLGGKEEAAHQIVLSILSADGADPKIAAAAQQLKKFGVDVDSLKRLHEQYRQGLAAAGQITDATEKQKAVERLQKQFAKDILAPTEAGVGKAIEDGKEGAVTRQLYGLARGGQQHSLDPATGEVKTEPLPGQDLKGMLGMDKLDASTAGAVEEKVKTVAKDDKPAAAPPAARRSAVATPGR